MDIFKYAIKQIKIKKKTFWKDSNLKTQDTNQNWMNLK